MDTDVVINDERIFSSQNQCVSRRFFYGPIEPGTRSWIRSSVSSPVVNRIDHDGSVFFTVSLRTKVNGRKGKKMDWYSMVSSSKTIVRHLQIRESL